LIVEDGKVLADLQVEEGDEQATIVLKKWFVLFTGTSPNLNYAANKPQIGPM
jgi:hypothetical protein